MQSADIALMSNVGALNVAKCLHESGRKVAFVVGQNSTMNIGSKTHFTEETLSRAGIGKQPIMYADKSESEDLFTDLQWCNATNANRPRRALGRGRGRLRGHPSERPASSAPG
jgi:hypothetical protein